MGTRSRSTPRHVLVVDDDDMNRRLVGLCLRGIEDVEVHEAPNGLAALRSIGVYRPALIILDVDMPGLDGYRLIQIIRRLSPWCGDVPLLVLSAAVEATTRSLAAGADECMMKPMRDPSVLRAKVSRWLDDADASATAPSPAQAAR